MVCDPFPPLPPSLSPREVADKITMFVKPVGKLTHYGLATCRALRRMGVGGMRVALEENLHLGLVR